MAHSNVGGSQFALSLVLVVAVLYVIWILFGCNRFTSETEEEDYDDEEQREHWQDDTVNTPPSTETFTGPTVSQYNLQDAINFSDVTVSDQQRAAWKDHIETTKQVQSVNERYDKRFTLVITTPCEQRG